MELPSLGKHCAERSCKLLDFLPMKCDACHNVFCKDHFRYNTHSCPEAYKQDNQVPQCPLCSKPIPVKPGLRADDVVGRHIDSDCQSDPARERRGKVYSNRCSKKGCKGKELIPMTCEKCQRNFCVRHRHELDHSCKGFENSGRQISKSGVAAVKRASKVTENVQEGKRNNGLQQMKITSYGKNSANSQVRTTPHQQEAVGGLLGRFQGAMSEEEALAQAIALSMGGTQASSSSMPFDVMQQQKQEEEDLALALAISQAEQEKLRSPQRQTVKVSS